MKLNMGLIDRIIRLIIVLTVAVLYFTNIISGTAGLVLLALAGIFVLTGLIGFCPLYFPFGINTGKKKS